VTTTRRDPRSGDTRELVLKLTPEAQAQLGRQELELPASMIFGVRREAVTLDRSLTELKKIQAISSLLRK
jgi:hypothetical protein